MLCGTPWRKITNRPWVGEGPGERLRSPVGPGQRPSKGPRGRRPPEALGVWGITEIYLNDNFEPTTPFLSDLTDRSRYVNPSKNYWFSFSSFIISLIGLYFRCLYFRIVLVNTASPDGAFLFIVWFIHRKRMIRPFLFIDKQKRKLSIHELVVDFWLANVTKLDDQNRFM